MSAPVAILGGTFDPIHIGHLRAAIEARELLGASQLRLLPCALPPHRQTPRVDAAMRLALAQAAIAGIDGLSIDDRELRRSGPSYTVDTLTELRQELGPLQPLVCVLGIDAFLGLPSWHRWRELLDLAHIAVMSRPDMHTLIDPKLEQLLAASAVASAGELAALPAGRILRLEIPLLPVSSTLIRARLAAGRSVRFLVPDSVFERIQAGGWYRHDGGTGPLSLGDL